MTAAGCHEPGNDGLRARLALRALGAPEIDAQAHSRDGRLPRADSVPANNLSAPSQEGQRNALEAVSRLRSSIFWGIQRNDNR